MRPRLLVTLAVAGLAILVLALAVARRERTVQRARAILIYGAGLREGASVSYRGVDVGRVTRLTFDTAGIAVDLAFQREVPLRTADSVRVRTLGIFGDHALDIVPGPHTAQLLPDNGLLASQPPPPEIPPHRWLELLQRPAETVYRGAPPPVSRP
jgi:phospholipid/cholesterol/gamma-HCH transport system substrate-binding protein